MIEVIGMATLLEYLQGSIAKMKDPRKPSPNKQYSIFDVVLSAFGVFFLSTGQKAGKVGESRVL